MFEMSIDALVVGDDSDLFSDVRPCFPEALIGWMVPTGITVVVLAFLALLATWWLAGRWSVPGEVYIFEVLTLLVGVALIVFGSMPC